MQTSLRKLALAGVVLLALSTRAMARCGDGPGDAAALCAARAEADRLCNCATIPTHHDYVRCVAGVAAAAVRAGTLPPACRRNVVRCAARSTCGRPGAVTCCRTFASGTLRCTVARSAAFCTPPRGGTARVGTASSCCDTCAPAGCGIDTTTTTTAVTVTSTTTTITSTTVSSTSSSSTSSTTSTTEPPTCGDGMRDPAEACDGDDVGGATCAGSAGGAFTCPSCTAGCVLDCSCCASGSCVTTTTTPTTSTTSTTTPAPTRLRFTALQGTTNCGGAALASGASPPTSGEVGGVGGVKLADLGLGCLYFGGGGNTSIAGIAMPDGGTATFAVGASTGAVHPLGPSAGTGPGDCTLGAGPTRHCLTDQTIACTSDADCGNRAGACALDARCFFGPPIPLRSLGTCIVAAIETDASGTLDTTSGGTSLSLRLNARAYVTGDGTFPCPRCLAAGCSAGQRVNLPCTTVGSQQTSIDCPPSGSQFTAALTLPLPSLGTASATMAAASGLFCPAQRTAGAFGQGSARSVEEQGQPAGSLVDGSAHPGTLVSTFCIPSTGSGPIDQVGDLPGPGAVSVRGSFVLD